MSTFTITRYEPIAQNAEWTFCVALCGGRWLPGALGRLEDGNSFFHVFPTPGHELGVEERDEAIRIASVVAADEGQGFGGVDRWHVEPWRRGNPDDYRCELCGELCCWGECAV